MSQTISRLYANSEAALRAVAALRGSGFSDVRHVSPPAAAVASAEGEEAPSTAPSTEDLAAGIAKGTISKAHAAIYAKGVAGGGTLVTVEAPFGRATKAIALLDAEGPIDSGIPASRGARLGASGPSSWHEAAPLSDMLGLPVLSNDPAPFSAFWNMPTSSSDPAPLSSGLGLGLLSRSAAPLSSTIGMPPLSEKAAPLSSAIGMPVLSHDPAPLSSRLGLPVLSHDPTPLSSWLGLKVLTKGRTTY